MNRQFATPNGYQIPNRDPGTAALMSLLPGLGQIYNGQTRKGLLFLAVDVTNVLLFATLIANHAIVGVLVSFSESFHMQVNGTLRYALSELRLNSFPSSILIGLMISYIALAMRDAYDHAAYAYRRQLYPEQVMELTEATSGSYLFHFSLIGACFLLAFFFLVPPSPERQITVFEFADALKKEERRADHPRFHAQSNSKASGKHEQKEVTPAEDASASRAHSVPKAATRPHRMIVPVHEPTREVSREPIHQPAPPVPRLRVISTAVPIAVPAPAPLLSRSQPPTLQPPINPGQTLASLPIVQPSLGRQPNTVPTPTVARPTVVGAGPTPSLVLGAGASQPLGAAPAPININTHSSSSGVGAAAPTPVPFDGSSAVKHGGSSGAATPQAARFSSTQDGGRMAGPIAVLPSLPGTDGTSGGARHGNPDANNHPDGPSANETGGDVDFGPFMDYLQRRIKQQWFPPRHEENKRVKVVFKVHRDGQLSGLRVVTSSGVSDADKAALSAVENAAPFRHLPEGAKEDVDIQFTFDYNVFNGSGRGTARNF